MTWTQVLAAEAPGDQRLATAAPGPAMTASPYCRSGARKARIGALQRCAQTGRTYRAAAAYAVRQPLLGATMGYAYFDQGTITALPIPGACVPLGMRRADERNSRNSVLRSPRLSGNELPRCCL